MALDNRTLRRRLSSVPGLLLSLGRGHRRHREYVGGMWEEIGELQFSFLLSRGLKPESYLLDIGCGSFRLGVKALPYLQRSHYLAIERNARLVSAGLRKEVGRRLARGKEPRIVISPSFEFERLGQTCDLAIAQSIFTHQPPAQIRLCLGNLHPWLIDGGAIYATFFETERETPNPLQPDNYGFFAYTRKQMRWFGETAGFSFTYLGDWNHPRGQKMAEFRKSANR